MVTGFKKIKRMECFIINVYLTLLIFNPLEAAVLLVMALKNFKIVFSKNNIKHLYILGILNYISQYLVGIIPASYLRLFLNFLNSVLIMGCILYCFLNIVNIKKIKLSRCFLATSFNLVTTAASLILLQDIFGFFAIPSDSFLFREFLINLIIKIIQFLLLYIFIGGFLYNEKFCKKFIKEN